MKVLLAKSAGFCYGVKRAVELAAKTGEETGGCWMLGGCAVALGAGILIAAIFPVGALMFLVAVLLIACGCACCRR